MKLVEVKDNYILEIPTLVDKELKNGAVIKAVELGESGRGSKLTLIPVPKWINNSNINGCNFQIGETKAGNIRLNVSKSIDNSNDVIVLVKPTFGFRGGVKFNLNNIDVLISGYISQGAAGRMGGNHHHLLILKDGDIISYKRYGRLYSKPAEWVVYNTKGDIFCMPKEEYDLLEEVD